MLGKNITAALSWGLLFLLSLPVAADWPPTVTTTDGTQSDDGSYGVTVTADTAFPQTCDATWYCSIKLTYTLYKSSDNIEWSQIDRVENSADEVFTSTQTITEGGTYYYKAFVERYYAENRKWCSPSRPDECSYTHGDYVLHSESWSLVTSVIVDLTGPKPPETGNLNLNAYDIFYGDLNDDGINDIYFRGKRQFILVHGEISVPIILPAPDSFWIRGLGSGYDEPLINSTLTDSEISAMELTPFDLGDIHSGDFNGDNQNDLLFTGISTSFILAGNAQGAPGLFAIYTTPLAYHNLTHSGLNIEVRDINGDGKDDLVIISSNPNYTDSAYISGSNGPEVYQAVNNAIENPVTLAGSTQGQFSVDGTGAANYSIPISVAAGTAGVAPRLSLVYSSQNGNGRLGQGWSLDGLSAITRCRQTLAQDGAARAISWSQHDRFCLDGRRLVLSSGGQYGAVGAVYKTEIDTYASIESVGGSLGHPHYFVITRKDGSVSTYGATSDAAQKTSDGKYTLTWAQNRFQDSVGNAIDFVYSNTANGHYIDQIYYAYGAANDSNRNNARARIAFSYDTDRLDPSLEYLGGYQFFSAIRLSRIDVYNDGMQIRNYQLRYRQVDAYSSLSNWLSKLLSVQECVGTQCLPATRFEWSEDERGFAASGTDFTLSNQRDRTTVKYLPADINGDGLQDIVWQEPDWDDGEEEFQDQHWFYMIGNSQGAFSPPIKLYSNYDNGSEPFPWSVIDYNMDGRSDIAIYYDQQWRVFLSKYSPTTVASDQGIFALTWRFVGDSIATGLTDEKMEFADLDSDGLIDAVSKTKIYTLQRNASAPVSSNQAYTFAQSLSYSLETLVPKPADTSYPDKKTYKDAYLYAPAGTPDFNGDGRVDLVAYRAVKRSYRIDNKTNSWNERHFYALIRTDTGFQNYAFIGSVNQTTNAGLLNNDIIAADFNNDGLSDIYQRAGVAVNTSSASGYPYAKITDASLHISNGIGFQPAGRSPWHNSPHAVDYNGDGLLDIVSYTQLAGVTNKLYVQIGTGTGFASSQAVGEIAGGLHAARQYLDVNGDSAADELMFEDDRLYLRLGLNSDDSPQNAISKIINGFGGETSIGYKPLTSSSVYERLSEGELYTNLNGPWDLPTGSHTLGKPYPVVELKGPLYVVGSVFRSAPSAGASPGNVSQSGGNETRYVYGDAKLQAGGRGMLGFQYIKRTNQQTGLESTTFYRQDFPFIGYPSRIEVRTPASHLISQTENIWRIQNWNNGNPGASLRLYLAESVEKTYALVNGGESQGEPLYSVKTHNSYDNYGNPTKIIVETLDTHESIVASKTTENRYGDTTWEQRMGRLSRSDVTTTRGATSKTRSSGFTYYTSGLHRGLLHTEVIEPDKADYKLTTTYEYDAFGNKIKATQTGVDVDPRYTRSEFDNSGRYIDTSYNSLEIKTEQITERNHLGAPVKIMGLNGLVTTFDYDALGRETSRSDNTGVWVETKYQSCSKVSCPTGAVMRVYKAVSGGGWSASYLDKLGREIRQTAVAFNGQEIRIDREYDQQGNVKRQSEPHGSIAQYWTEYEYDRLGRLVESKLPGIRNSVLIAYDGLAVTTTNPAGQTKTEVSNELSELIEVRDNIGGRITYEYDVHGNVSSTTHHGSVADPRNIVTTITYDDVGRKIVMTDPDKGDWSYSYNVFGEMIQQTDAKKQKTTFIYDSLGRLERRAGFRADGTLESLVTWTYDTAPNGVGALDNVQDSVSGYMRAHSYDSLGRLSETGTYLPGNLGTHWEKITYDSVGRIDKVFDAAGDGSWNNHAVKSVYNQYGYLRRVVDAFNTSTSYYTVVAMDKRGNVTESMGGSGVTSYNIHDAATGRLTGIRSELTAGFGDVQNHTYTWDDIGNLKERKDQSGNKNLVENFGYDGLNRLISAQVSGEAEQKFVYNSIGNISFKTGIGEFGYGNNAGPHALTSTADGVNYSYDANGNLVNESAVGDIGGRTIKYTTFDKPYEISKDGHKTEFKYGPDRARYVRYDTDADNQVTTTRYIGNVEKITKPDGSQQIKRYLPGDVLITLELDSQNNQTGSSTQFLYKDHLGSIDVIADATGKVTEDFSFDAWGERRSAADWRSQDIASLLNFDHSTTTLGYTGHETLDEVGLVHMNGRVYDPRLARFFQADPFVQAVLNTQLYNRYSYVGNNPLNATDPSGYFAEVSFLIIEAFFKAIYDLAKYDMRPTPDFNPYVKNIGAGVSGNAYGNSPKEGELNESNDPLPLFAGNGWWNLHIEIKLNQELFTAKSTLDKTYTETTGGKFANGADTQTFLVTQSPTMDMEAGASDVKGIDISNLLIDLSLEVIPGGGLYKCSRDGCDAWDWVGATVDLVPGFGKVGKLFKLRKLVARKPRITIRGCSFAAGTLVATAVGAVAIEDIEVGDFVLAKNEESGEVKARRVNSVFADRHDSVISLVVRDEEGNQEVIITTEEHPFYVAESGWVTAGDVVPGTYFEALDGDRLELVGKEVIVKPQFAYNFEVDEYHTYGVGKAGVWVHNDCEYVATKGAGKFDVGPYNEIKGTVSGLDAHHAGQKAAMKKLVDGYDPNTGPSILVPKVGHTIKGPNGIVSRSAKGINSARDLVARDIKELRRVYPGAPNSQLQKLINLNKEMYPTSFKK